MIFLVHILGDFHDVYCECVTIGYSFHSSSGKTFMEWVAFLHKDTVRLFFNVEFFNSPNHDSALKNGHTVHMPNIKERSIRAPPIVQKDANALYNMCVPKN